MHGQPVGVTWTHLDATATSGSSEIILKEPVDWKLGSQIVIASTGDKFSPGENELRIIVAKSNDNKTLSLNKELKHDHLCEKRTVGSGNNTQHIYIKAEVGLLSRNVLFQGNSDSSWSRLLSAPACPDGV